MTNNNHYRLFFLIDFYANEDSSNHGIGTEIINDIIKTYDGYSKAEITDNLYNVLIALKLPE